MKIKYHILSDSIVLTFNGQTETISSAHIYYQEFLDAIRDDRLDEIPAIMKRAEKFYLLETVK